MMRLAGRVDRLGTESAFAVLAEVSRLEAKGRSIISFAIGEPDFETPQNVKEAGMRSIEAGDTHYVPAQGIFELREVVASHVAATRRISVNPDEVVITSGGKPVIFYTILACVQRGDEVLVPNPGFPIYQSAVEFAGGKAVSIPLLEERDFRMDIDALEESVSDKTRMIVLNSPQNPTGSVLTPGDLERIAEVAKRHNLWVLSDEIYSRLIYDGSFASIASIEGMKDRTIILDGFSKTYAMTGWRLGYGVMPDELAEVVTRMIVNCQSCTPPFVQRAGIEALTGPQNAVSDMAAEFDRRRKLVVSLLRDIPGFSCRMPGGAFYAFPNVTEACKKLGLPHAKAFEEYLLHEANVAVLSRSAFGSKNHGEEGEYIRISYATSEANIKEGLDRIRQAVVGG